MNDANNSIECITPDYSKFNHSHRVLGTTGIGRLQPIYSRLLMPGESLRADVMAETYFQPLTTAIKQKFDVCYHWFAVPTRIISGGKSEKYYFPDPRKMHNMRSNAAEKPHINVTFDKVNVPFFDTLQILQPDGVNRTEPIVPRSYNLGKYYHKAILTDSRDVMTPRVVSNLSANIVDLMSDEYREPQFGKGSLADCFGFPARPAKDYSFEGLPVDYYEDFGGQSPIYCMRFDWCSLADSSSRYVELNKIRDFLLSMGYSYKEPSYFYTNNIFTYCVIVGAVYVPLAVVFFDEISGNYVDLTEEFPVTIGSTTKRFSEWCDDVPNWTHRASYDINQGDGTAQSEVTMMFPYIGDTEDGLRVGLPGYWYKAFAAMQPQDGSNVQQIECWKWRAYMSIVDRFYRDRNYSEELPLDEFFAHTGDEDSNLLQSDVFDPTEVNGFCASNYNKYMHNVEGYPLDNNYYYNESARGYSNFLVDKYYYPSVRAVETDEFTSVLPSTIAGETGTTAPLAFDNQLLSAQNYLTALTADDDHAKNAEWLGSDLHIDTNALGLNIEALRNSLRVNQFLKMMHYGGYLPDEQQQMLFSVINKDYRALRPTYLDGCCNGIAIGDIMNTTLTEYAPLGQLGAVASNDSHTGISYHADEYTVIMCICSIRPKVYYQGGLSKLDTRLNYLDEFKPQFADLGEQEVYSSEINWVPFDLGSGTDKYCDHAKNNDAVGYQSRYYEYKYTLDRLQGDFHDSMSYWQTSKEWDPYTNVVIDNDFMLVNEHDYDNIFAVVDGTDRIYQQFNFDIAIKSPLNMITETKLI